LTEAFGVGLLSDHGTCWHIDEAGRYVILQDMGHGGVYMLRQAKKNILGLLFCTGMPAAYLLTRKEAFMEKSQSLTQATA
jgi:hypothetical protein